MLTLTNCGLSSKHKTYEDTVSYFVNALLYQQKQNTACRQPIW